MWELIRRQRTSGTVLQTFLRYIEVVHRTLPKIATTPGASMKDTIPEESPQDGEPTTPGSLILSPLLCPCCTFLASLILASNLVQNRCYSDRVQVKRSRLSPHEDGQCEKAHSDRDSGPANNSRDHWSDLEATLICRWVRSLEVEHPLRLEQHSNVQTVVLTPLKLDLVCRRQGVCNCDGRHSCSHYSSPCLVLSLFHFLSSVHYLIQLI